jgi:ribokinase
MPAPIVVLGSLNMDFVVQVARLPSPGETVLGSNFQMIPGGKGANQACAAGRLGGRSALTRMMGRVGYDVFGDHLKASLSASGVDVTYVHATKSQPTGVALIWVDRTGQNSIVVASGANHAMSAADVEGLRGAFRAASFALFQLETPLPVVAAALALAREEGVRTILDPAPAQALTRELLGSVDVLTPNESEAMILLASDPKSPVEDPSRVTRALLALGPKAVILKLGPRGCFYDDGTSQIVSPAFPFHALDTTAAGDTFNGALAVALAEGEPLDSALRFANAAAGLSVTRLGAQASIPSRKEVDDLLSAN